MYQSLSQIGKGNVMQYFQGRTMNESSTLGNESQHQVQFSRTFETIHCKIFAFRSTFCLTASLVVNMKWLHSSRQALLQCGIWLYLLLAEQNL